MTCSILKIIADEIKQVRDGYPEHRIDFTVLKILPFYAKVPKNNYNINVDEGKNLMKQTKFYRNLNADLHMYYSKPDAG